MENVVEAAGIIIFTRLRPIRFLLMKHTNRWDLPKGHSEANESILETALRETEEETGIPSSLITIDPEFKFVLQYPVEGKRRGRYLKRVTYLLGEIEEPLDIQTTEHIGFKWVDWPPAGPIQQETIDPLLAEVHRHFDRRTPPASTR